MSASGVRLEDPNQLGIFADKVRLIVDAISAYLEDARRAPVQMGGLQPGQDGVLIGQGAQTQMPTELAVQFEACAGEIAGIGGSSATGSNVQTLIDKLNLIATAAEGIAKNYKTATDLERMQVSDIQAALNLPVTGVLDQPHG